MLKGQTYLLMAVLRLPDASKYQVIIGLTIVAFGTSAPELAVSTTAALKQSNDLALSNVVGSNIFNLLVVLGSCAVFAPVPSSTEVLKRDMPFSLIITALVWMLGGGAASMLLKRVIALPQIR